MAIGIIGFTPVRRGADGILHAGPQTPVFEEILNSYVNRNEIRDMDFVSGVVVNADEKRIILTSGWSPDRGLFCDSY